MLKHIFRLSAATLILAGCATAPQTPAEMRSFSYPFLEKSSVSVSRPSGAVASALKRGAERCLNTTSEQSFARATQFGGHTTTIRHYYDATVRRTGSGRAELMIYKTTTGAITPGAKDGRYLAYLVDVMPARSGTQLNIYGGKIGYDDLNASVVRWAKGGAMRCPTMP